MVDRPRRGEIYWTDFEPVQGSEQGGLRPAVVIQNDLGNLASTVTIVAAITSKMPPKQYPFHVRIPDGLLPKPSVVLCNQIRTVSKERLDGKPLAELPSAVLAEVEEALMSQLGLSPGC